LVAACALFHGVFLSTVVSLKQRFANRLAIVSVIGASAVTPLLSVTLSVNENVPAVVESRSLQALRTKSTIPGSSSTTNTRADAAASFGLFAWSAGREVRADAAAEEEEVLVCEFTGRPARLRS
jgi:hypothetical protein